MSCFIFFACGWLVAYLYRDARADRENDQARREAFAAGKSRGRAEIIEASRER